MNIEIYSFNFGIKVVLEIKNNVCMYIGVERYMLCFSFVEYNKIRY